MLNHEDRQINFAQFPVTRFDQIGKDFTKAGSLGGKAYLANRIK